MAYILIVDDNEQNRYMLEALLKGHGYGTMSADNGLQALSAGREQTPELVITDLLMPELDGFELCRQWKSDPELSHIPLIVYTATYTEPQDEKLALSLGADRFLIKPMEPDAIIREVRAMLEKSENSQSTESKAGEGAPEGYHEEYGQVVSRKLDKKVQQLQEEIQVRKKVEEALRESENRFRLVAEAATDLIYEWDSKENILQWFGSIDEALGFSEGDFPSTANAWIRQIHGDDCKRLFDLRDVAENEACVIKDEYRIAQADGSWRYWVDKVDPAGVKNGKVVRWIGACVDVTEQRSLEMQLYQAQKMEAVGQLAGGIAHDFNNLIQVILGYSDLIMWGPHLDEKVRHNFDQIHAAAKKASGMTRQLLAFSRRQVLSPMYLALNSLVSDLLKMIERLVGEQIEVEWQPGTSLGVISADPGQLDQVLLNLCVNARDAIGQSGTMVISTRNVTLDEDYCAANPWAKQGGYVMLQVEDDGCGMDAKTMDQIFQPFFTTKEEGKGTGLGLSTVYGIVKQHDGLINVKSTVGWGSTFQIFFPKMDRLPRDLNQQGALDLLGGTETILVAEDQKLLLDMTQHILEREGYTVLTARNGKEAISVAKACQDSIDLALLDVVMPVVGGKEAMESIATINPSIKFLFTSGHSQEDIHEHFMTHEGIHIIRKPFPGELLLRKIREVLDHY